MENNHLLFGKLTYDEYDGYRGKIPVSFSGNEEEVELIISEIFGDGGIEDGHREAYDMLSKNWEDVVQEVVQSVLIYQNEIWDSTDHTQCFPKFQTENDVLKNIELISITLEAKAPDFRGQQGRYAVMVFNAEWVNDDYHLLSVALINEKVVEISDQAI
ncbi:DUF6985 domain-containing protein [Enterococcus larvae]|uniref:DUF6985 domain-containing protein n=1 Tax=Enterococcus larvae TaxID=2794352 RepID=UPI003F2D084D